MAWQRLRLSLHLLVHPSLRRWGYPTFLGPRSRERMVSKLRFASRLSPQRTYTLLTSGSTPPLAAPSGTSAPPKKFSAFNINKKFMEKNSPTPGASQIPSSSPSSKIAGTTSEFSSLYVRPIKSLPTDGSAKSPPPLATSHSRLVTTKLTKLPSSSTGGSTGWTRPSSTTPSLAPSPVSGSVSSAPPVAPAPISHGPPQFPHVGKVIQPQPRGAIQAPLAPKLEASNGSSKPAWRTVKQGGNGSGAGPPLGVQSEFPTAAEVAQGASV